MTSNAAIDGVLIEWGQRLFYPRNRTVKTHTPRLHVSQDRAAAIRSRIEATVRRAPQVMVKVTGGGRGMAAAHFRYITKNGRLDIEDDPASSSAARTPCAKSSGSGSTAAPASSAKAIAARPSTSCCRCRAAPTR